MKKSQRWNAPLLVWENCGEFLVIHGRGRRSSASTMAERSPVNPTCSDETRSTAPVKQEEKQDGLNEPERQAEDLGTPNNDCQGADVESTADPAQAREGLSAITVPADQAPDVVASHHQALVNAVLAGISHKNR